MKYTRRAAGRMVWRVIVAFAAFVAMAAVGIVTSAHADSTHTENGTVISIASDNKGTDPSYYNNKQLWPVSTIYTPKVHVTTNGLTEALTNPYLDITLNSFYGVNNDPSIPGGDRRH